MSILLIDGLNLIRRVHAGVPEVSEDRDDAVLNACVASMRRALRRHLIFVPRLASLVISVPTVPRYLGY